MQKLKRKIKTETLFDISEVEDGYKIDACKGNSDEVVIPRNYKNGKIVEIGTWAFTERATVKNVILHEGLK